MKSKPTPKGKPAPFSMKGKPGKKGVKGC